VFRVKRSRIIDTRIKTFATFEETDMTLDASPQETEFNEEPSARSPAVERMRLHRQRRRLGLRCIVIELRETEVDELVRRGLLTEDARDDRFALRKAVHSHLDQTLTPTRWNAA
jgi:hypothetical protein